MTNTIIQSDHTRKISPNHSATLTVKALKDFFRDNNTPDDAVVYISSAIEDFVINTESIYKDKTCNGIPSVIINIP